MSHSAVMSDGPAGLPSPLIFPAAAAPLVEAPAASAAPAAASAAASADGAVGEFALVLATPTEAWATCGYLATSELQAASRRRTSVSACHLGPSRQMSDSSSGRRQPVTKTVSIHVYVHLDRNEADASGDTWSDDMVLRADDRFWVLVRADGVWWRGSRLLLLSAASTTTGALSDDMDAAQAGGRLFGCWEGGWLLLANLMQVRCVEKKLRGAGRQSCA
ncbi:hypothetical protein BC831DRAFT_445825 [Entophlyctis helioformis]|nr:hypothetical protein BC831DRAFT_445825 [Entophlyctis helioformis]